MNKFENLSKDRQKSAKVNDFFGSERKIIFNDQSGDIFDCPTYSKRKRGESENVKPEKDLLSFESATKKILEIENDHKTEATSSVTHYIIALLTVGSTVYTVFFI